MVGHDRPSVLERHPSVMGCIGTTGRIGQCASVLATGMARLAGAGAATGSAHIAGRDADSPWAIPWPAWKAILRRTWSETSEDNMGLVAAGVAFYGFLAIVPMMAALVLIYGLVADVATVLRDIGTLAELLPAYAAKFIAHQLVEVVQASDGKKGLGLAVAIGVALFGARNGAASIVTALNIAYEETETRGIVRLTWIALTITVAAVLLAALAVVAISALGHLENVVPAIPDAMLSLGKILSYIMLALGGAAGAATLYRYGPDRAHTRWVWLTPGSVFAALGWMILSLGFGVYVSNVDDYSATYGSLSAIAVMLTWLYLSSYILLLGAEFNSELEHQTAKDTTEGAEQPLGSREAWAADHVAGEAARPAPPPSEHIGTDAANAGSAKTFVSDYLVLRTAGRAAHLAGLARNRFLPSAVAAAGLVFLGRRGEARKGAALLAVAGGLAWLHRAPLPGEAAARSGRSI